MTLKDVRDKLSRMFAEDRSLESKEINHILIEDVDGINHFDYMLKDEDSDVEEDDDYEYDDDSYEDESDDYDYDEDDSELEEESWESDDDSDLEESY